MVKPEGAAKVRPVPLYDHGDLAVIYKPTGWICGSDPLEPKIGGLPLRDRNKLIHELTKQESPPIQAWILLQFGCEKGSPVIRDNNRDNGLCHRLDIGTSGPVLVGKTDKSFDYAKTQIHERDLVKDYLALVHGSVSGERGACRAAIDRTQYEKTRRVRCHESGDPAVSLWEVIAHYETVEPPKIPYTLVHVRIITGRTHQIRAHLANMGHPIMSDWGYCEDETMLWRDYAMCKRIFLHKFRVSFVDMQGFPVCVSCPLQMDPDLWNCLKRLRLVNGMAAHGCLAPGLRGTSASQPSNNPRFRSVPVGKEKRMVAPQRAAHGRQEGNGKKGGTVSRASSAPATTRQSESRKVPHRADEAHSQPKNKRARVVSPKRDAGGGGGSDGGPPRRLLASQGSWNEPVHRPSTIKQVKPVGVQPSQQQRQPQKQQQQLRQQPKQQPSLRPAKPQQPKPQQPTKPQQPRAQQGQHPKELQRQLRPPPRIPGQSAPGKVGSVGSTLRRLVSTAAANRPPRPPSQGAKNPIGASGLKVGGRAGPRPAGPASGEWSPPAEQEEKHQPGSLVQRLLAKVKHTPRQA